MPTLIDEHSHLRLANDHLRTAVYLIAAQEDRLARYCASGLDTRLPEELLFTMQAILRNFIAHRQAICDAIELGRRSLCPTMQMGVPQRIIRWETPVPLAGKQSNQIYSSPPEENLRGEATVSARPPKT
ncbi:hypothetical protein [Burkholderia pseudomallei]|nr:hypothetical protein [Burkholderia pseudomallei]